MKIILAQCPTIRNYMQLTQVYQLSDNISLIVVFKNLFRSDNIIVDIYRNEITEESKIISGKSLMSNLLISPPKPEEGLNFSIFCLNKNGINESITKHNLHKFYLQFTSILDGENWDSDLKNALKYIES